MQYDNKLLTSLGAQRKVLLDQVEAFDHKISYWESCVSSEGREVVAMIRQKRTQVSVEQGPCRA